LVYFGAWLFNFTSNELAQQVTVDSHRSPQRGKGPWPAGNDERAVMRWLADRLNTAEVDTAEIRSLIRNTLSHVTGMDRGERMMGAYRYREAELDRLAVIVERLGEGEPWQHISGTVVFMGLELTVSPDVLIPRPETEELVAWAVDRVSENPSGARLLDMGTGSGCIALAMKDKLPGLEVTAWDVSKEALAVAESNAARSNLTVEFAQQDILLASPPEKPYDLILSNPPYIPESEKPHMARNVTAHEPSLALFVPGSEPLLFYRAILAFSENGGLIQGGWLGMECHTRYADEVARLLRSHGAWSSVSVRSDLQGMPRHVVARLA
jgi:release factor glutamine methyltransferase